MNCCLQREEEKTVETMAGGEIGLAIELGSPGRIYFDVSHCLGRNLGDFSSVSCLAEADFLFFHFISLSFSFRSLFPTKLPVHIFKSPGNLGS